MTNFLNIDLKSEKDFHADLILTILAIEFKCVADSYYLMLDRNITNIEGDYEKVRIVLLILLKQWKIKVENLKVNGKCFLPFDFSDEYIGCLKFEEEPNGQLKGVFGFTQEFGGYEFFPSDLDGFIIDESKFEIDSDSFIISKDDLLLNIDAVCHQFNDKYS